MSVKIVNGADEDTEYVLITDAIGQGIDLRLYRDRGILSVVLVDGDSLMPIAASAEVEFSELQEAIDLLQGG